MKQTIWGANLAVQTTQISTIWGLGLASDYKCVLSTPLPAKKAKLAVQGFCH